ncbi:MAG: DUF2807 domain-containing protein [Cyclobacteriaceae bacterium]|nr:MAG: DUF2807 domain-containing protein [Cyclobacteriaceae bacterium]
MNKLTLINLVYFGLVIVSQACYIDLDHDRFGCKNADGPRTTETFDLPPFDRITNSIGANIVIRQDNQRELTITTQRSVLDNITTRIVDGELIIDNRYCFRNSDIDIFISNPEIAAVHNIGSGDIYGDNTWNAPLLELKITGSGTIDAKFESDQLFTEITGSGNLRLFGVANQSTVKISGSGNVAAFNLDCNHQNINISGSGNCEVIANDVLEVKISGSGNVFYKGSPSVSSDISGSGGVFKAN